MEQIIQIFIYIHAFFGGVGLIAGIGSIITKKGSKQHKLFGKFFTIGMLTSSLISIPIAWMPNHENLFLFLIGVFTVYLVLAGNRALSFKKGKVNASTFDRLISGIMLLFSVVMIVLGVYGLIKGNSGNILFVFFGGFGLLLTIRDFQFYKSFKEKKNLWLINHISRIVGAFIASVTAFLIAGVSFESILAWVLPSIIGTIYIIFWIRKIKPKQA